MSYVIAAPEMLATAAADVDGIGSAIRAASASAAGPTTGLLAAAADEVSSAAAALFSEYARECQEVLKQAAAFHGEFTRALAAAGAAYAQAEASNTAAMSGTAGSSGALGSVGMLSGNPLTALMMGGTGEPILSDRVLAIIDSAYIRPIFGPNNPVAQYTPEQWWPFIGNLSLDQSIAQGVTLLNNGINAELQNGHDVVVFGYSQSAAVATNEIRALMALPPGQAPDPSRLAFTLIGNINNPNGGVLERYVGLYLPFLDMSFNGATPPDSPYQTYMYTGQYDGYAHNPQYPLNILSDLNAFMGIRWVHNAYPFTAAEVANAVPLPTSPGYTGNTHYYMFLTQDLPLLQPIRAIPFVGTPIAELIQPDLRVLVDLGYGYGYADVPTPASLFAPINPRRGLGPGDRDRARPPSRPSKHRIVTAVRATQYVSVSSVGESGPDVQLRSIQCDGVVGAQWRPRVRSEIDSTDRVRFTFPSEFQAETGCGSIRRGSARAAVPC